MCVREIAFRVDVAELRGDIWFPESDGQHPLLVLVQGSGPEERMRGAFRDHFTEHGIATLSWDKQGCGESTGDFRTQQIIYGRAAEVDTAVTAAMTMEGLGFSQIGLWGISQGGWIGPLVASRNPSVGFVIPVSAPGMTVAEQIVYATKQAMIAGGMPLDAMEGASSAVRQGLDALRGRRSYAWLVENVIAPAAEKPWGEMLAGQVQEAEWNLMVSTEDVQNLDYDPTPILQTVTCPVLAIFGGEDVLLPPYASAEVMRTTLGQAGNDDVTVKVFPTADHQIRETETALAEGYLDLMSKWILARNTPKAT